MPLAVSTQYLIGLFTLSQKKTFTIDGREIAFPIRLATDLNFPAEDIKTYPWLGDAVGQPSGARYYMYEKELGKGGYAIALLCHPCNENGEVLPDAPPLVMKIPRIGPEHEYTSEQRAQRNTYIRERVFEEWALSRAKLKDSKNGVGIFDLGEIRIDGDQFVFATVQEFIDNALILDDWLVEQRLKSKPYLDREEGDEQSNWHGIESPEEWMRVALLVAEALTDIHQRRIVHGDIWPPNIFIKQSESEYAILIDFGESFISTPTGSDRSVADHAYRAPERDGEQYVPTEQVDVYSFGKVLLYLATGLYKHKIKRNLRGHARRQHIRDLIFERNERLVVRNPWIVDIITQCAAYDSVARPSIMDLRDQIAYRYESIVNPGARRRNQIIERLQSVTDMIEDKKLHENDILSQFVDLKLVEIERLARAGTTDSLRVKGERSQLIMALSGLLDAMKDGDSWSTMTVPSVWQGKTLGLDGRYLTSTCEAILRGVNVHRTYVLSVEELGIEWSEDVAAELRQNCGSVGELMAAQLTEAIAYCKAAKEASGYRMPQPHFIDSHRIQFLNVLDSLSTLITKYDIQKHIYADEFSDLQDTKGLFLGLKFLPTIQDVRTIRRKNPVVLIYLSNQKEDKDKWMLLMTDIGNRNEEYMRGYDTPVLHGVRVYRSALGIPHDRRINLRVLNQESINIGPDIMCLTETFRNCLS